jgi:hypothetical protein
VQACAKAYVCVSSMCAPTDTHARIYSYVSALHKYTILPLQSKFLDVYTCAWAGGSIYRKSCLLSIAYIYRESCLIGIGMGMLFDSTYLASRWVMYITRIYSSISIAVMHVHGFRSIPQFNGRPYDPHVCARVHCVCITRTVRRTHACAPSVRACVRAPVCIPAHTHARLLAHKRNNAFAHPGAYNIYLCI